MSNLKYKAIILLMSTSGMDTGTIKKLSLNDFINATKDYAEYCNLTDLIKQLRTMDYIIPTWYIRRSKTSKDYFTFNTPECTMAILDYLEYYQNPQTMIPTKSEDPLFPGGTGIPYYFEKLNDQLGLGWKEHRRFFHAHSLRKFFANTLEEKGMPHLITRFIMGHSLDKVTNAYFKPNPISFKEEYRLKVPYLSMEKVVVEDKTPHQIKEIVSELEDLKTDFERYKLANEIRNTEDNINRSKK